ncbi:MAG: ATP-binding protein [Bacteroidales bacterium]|nr:ATP-binding protein [Bacteroidales bacterium]
MSEKKIKKIVLTGPESTGKSTLTKKLAEHFSVPYIAEIARDYVEELTRPYTKNDVIEIAKMQIDAEKKITEHFSEFIFLDTDLIITKIWLQHLYNDYPKWIDNWLKEEPAFLHLLCYYDLPWEFDPVRENSEMRPYFFNKYLEEIKKINTNYGIIKGQGEKRFENALKIVNNSL